MTVVQLQVKGNGRTPTVARNGLFAALDIGSTKICCLIAEAVPAKHRTADGDEHSLRVLGVGHQLSRGIRCGTVINVDEAERSIRLAVDAAERMAQRTIEEVYVNVSGGRPLSRLYTSTVPVPSGHVTQRDIDNVLESVLAKVDPGRRSVLHMSPVQYHLDEVKGVKTPAGMYGETLGLDLGVVTVEQPHLKNLTLSVEHAHLVVADFVSAPYAAARAVLTEDERTLGTTVVDMGGATTSFAVFHENNLVHADTIPLGGHHITNDIARGLSTTIAHAERMKTLWGSALASQVDEREMIAVPLLGERGVDTVQQVPKSMLTGIIRPRLEEIFEMLRDKLEFSGVEHLAGRRLVMTGGASQLNGVREIAGQWLDRQVRMGVPTPVQGMPETARTPGFAVCAGLLSYALKPDQRLALPNKAKAQQVVQGRSGYVRRMGRWIAESF